jgi:hypothetical protein
MVARHKHIIVLVCAQTYKKTLKTAFDNAKYITVFARGYTNFKMVIMRDMAGNGHQMTRAFDLLNNELKRNPTARRIRSTLEKRVYKRAIKYPKYVIFEKSCKNSRFCVRSGIFPNESAFVFY